VKIRHLIITAGPTYEPIDPIRVITNRSTGLMGYEIALEAVRRGYHVTLIKGPCGIKPIAGVETIGVESAADMEKAIKKSAKKNSCLIMAAAVSDYKVKAKARKKIKGFSGITLHLVRNKDILASVKKADIGKKIGFALETENLIENARKKLIEKGLDLIVANKSGKKNVPFGSGRKDFVFLERSTAVRYYRKATKKQVASALLDTLKNRVL